MPACLPACLPATLSACCAVCLQRCLPATLSACSPDILSSACVCGIAPSSHHSLSNSLAHTRRPPPVNVYCILFCLQLLNALEMPRLDYDSARKLYSNADAPSGGARTAARSPRSDAARPLPQCSAPAAQRVLQAAHRIDEPRLHRAEHHRHAPGQPGRRQVVAGHALRGGGGVLLPGGHERARAADPSGR